MPRRPKVRGAAVDLVEIAVLGRIDAHEPDELVRVLGHPVGGEVVWTQHAARQGTHPEDDGPVHRAHGLGIGLERQRLHGRIPRPHIRPARRLAHVIRLQAMRVDVDDHEGSFRLVPGCRLSLPSPRYRGNSRSGCSSWGADHLRYPPRSHRLRLLRNPSVIPAKHVLAHAGSGNLVAADPVGARVGAVREPPLPLHSEAFEWDTTLCTAPNPHHCRLSGQPWDGDVQADAPGYSGGMVRPTSVQPEGRASISLRCRTAARARRDR